MTRRSRKTPEPKVELLQEQGALHPHPHQVDDPAFVDSEFFDPRDLVQVKYEMLRRVKTEGQSVAVAARAFGLSRPTYYKTQQDFERSGLLGLLPRKRGPRGPHKLTVEAMALIEHELDNNEQLSAEQLAGLVEQAFGYRVHPRTIERRLARMKKKRR